MLVLAAASLLGTFSSVFTTVGQFFHLLAFQMPIYQNLTDRGRQKQPLLYLTVAAKSSNFSCDLYNVSDLPSS